MISQFSKVSFQSSRLGVSLRNSNTLLEFSQGDTSIPSPTQNFDPDVLYCI